MDKILSLVSSYSHAHRQGVNYSCELIRMDNIWSNIRFLMWFICIHHGKHQLTFDTNFCGFLDNNNHLLQAQAALQFESQTKKDVMSIAEQEELAVRKRREEGTPVTDETFAEWWAKFSMEMEQKKEGERAFSVNESKDKKKDANAAIIMEERLTGFQIFSDKAGVFNLELLEAAAEEMANDTSALDPDQLGEVDEELFDDDEDLDDLEFDSDDVDDDDDDDNVDSDDEPDI